MRGVNESLRRVSQLVRGLAPSPQLRYQREGRYVLRDGVALIGCDVHDPTNNVAVVLGPAPEPERILALAAEFFGTRPGGWGVVVEAGAEHPVELELRARGWRIAEEEPALLLTPIPAAPAQPPDFEIRRVTTEASLYDFYRASRAGFADAESASADSPAGEDLTKAFVPSVACALDPDMAYFVGYVEGKAAATAGLCRFGSIAEIIGISVVPTSRRRGLGAAITWAAVAEGVARGCTFAALTATPMGEPVYRRMGFQYVCTFRTYVPARSGRQESN